MHHRKDQIGTPLYAEGWWLIPVVHARKSASRIPVFLPEAPQPQRAPAEELRVAFQVSRKFPLARPEVHLIAARRRPEHDEEAYGFVLCHRGTHVDVLFEMASVDVKITSSICNALRERICRIRRDVPIDTDSESRWSVDDLVNALGEFERIDDGTDLLAFRLQSPHSNRTMYIWLYGAPDLISFDLEDSSVDTDTWDHAVARGAVDNRLSLIRMARSWLRHGRLPGLPGKMAG